MKKSIEMLNLEYAELNQKLMESKEILKETERELRDLNRALMRCYDL